jgi:hypothetical protein
MIGWILGIIGVVFALGGGVFFLKSLTRMKGELATGIIYLVLASIFYVVFSGIFIIFGLYRLPINNGYWEIVPVLIFGSGVLFSIGGFKLAKLFNSLK